MNIKTKICAKLRNYNVYEDELSHKENVLQLKCYTKVLLIQTFEDIFIDR